jgi:hypothetical protein
VKIEGTAEVLTVYYAGFGAGFASESYRFSEKVDVTIAITGVGTVGDDYFVTIIGIVDRGLNIIEICRTVIVDSDSSCLRANNKNQAHANEG